MKKGVIAIIVAVVVLLLFFVGQYNSLVSEQTAVEEHAANIDTQLQRRADLIPNLVKTVKSFAEHETAVFSEVTKAREALLAARTMGDKAEADAAVTTALDKLVAVAENYPELKSDAVYTQLMDELAGTENRISYAREEYNAAAASYNKAIRMFPGSIFANMFGFERVDLFEAADNAKDVPEVDL